MIAVWEATFPCEFRVVLILVFKFTSVIGQPSTKVGQSEFFENRPAFYGQHMLRNAKTAFGIDS